MNNAYCSTSSRRQSDRRKSLQLCVWALFPFSSPEPNELEVNHSSLNEALLGYEPIQTITDPSLKLLHNCTRPSNHPGVENLHRAEEYFFQLTEKISKATLEARCLPMLLRVRTVTEEERMDPSLATMLAVPIQKGLQLGYGLLNGGSTIWESGDRHGADDDGAYVRGASANKLRVLCTIRATERKALHKEHRVLPAFVQAA